MDEARGIPELLAKASSCQIVRRTAGESSLRKSSEGFRVELQPK
jgi:hypothetical protein